MSKKLTFDDVLIEPQFSTISSRSEVSLQTKLGSLQLDLPIISANMDTVTGCKMAKAMRENGAIGCLHRFCSPEKTISMLNIAGTEAFVSFGLGETERERVNLLKTKTNVKGFILDVAHGAQMQVWEQVQWFKENYSDMYLIVGNFASASSVKDFIEYGGGRSWRPDAFKIGIGPGSACTTRVKTGVGVPQISALIEIKQYIDELNITGIGHQIQIVLDGGMRSSGDIAKALAAGADAVMLGGMLAGTDETPGEDMGGYDTVNGALVGSPPYRRYRGSASKESYDDQNKDWATAEGESFAVECKGPVKEVLDNIKGGLQSSLSYVGARDIQQFKEKANLIKISSNAQLMGNAHGKK